MALPIGLVAYYKFEETPKVNGTQLVDESGYGNHGAYRNAPTGFGAMTLSDVAGFTGRAAYFDTTQAYPNNDGGPHNAITVTALTGLGGITQSFAVDCRVKVGTLDPTYRRGLFGVGSTINPVLGWCVTTGPTGTLAFTIGGSVGNFVGQIISPKPVFPSTDFVRILALYDSIASVMKLYVNSVLIGSKKVGSWNPGSQPFSIGGAYDEFVVGAGSFKHCRDTTFDEMKIYTFVAPPARSVVINASIGRDGEPT